MSVFNCASAAAMRDGFLDIIAFIKRVLSAINFAVKRLATELHVAAYAFCCIETKLNAARTTITTTTTAEIVFMFIRNQDYNIIYKDCFHLIG
jgi:hypothetical protein